MDPRPDSSRPDVSHTEAPSAASTAAEAGRPADLVPGLEHIDADLARLVDLPVAEHVQIFAGIHQQLTAALALTSGQPVGQPAQAHGQHPGRPNQPGQPGPRPPQWSR